jgi:hypothetical protein
VSLCQTRLIVRGMVGLKKLKDQPFGCDLLNRNDRVWVWTFSLLSITVLQFGAMCACSPAIPSEFCEPENKCKSINKDIIKAG